MKRLLIYIAVLAVLTSGLAAPLLAKSAGTTTGLALLRTSGARPSGLGNAFTGMSNDIQAFEFNPGSLATLEREQVSLQYQAGLADDSFSKASLGWRVPKGTLGFSIGQYDSGEVKLFDGVNTQQSVTAEKDLVVNAGYGLPLGKTTVGANVRYLSSRLADRFSDTAYAVDAGLQVPVLKHLRFGLSGPLVQTKIQYADVQEDLPRVYRAGFLADVNLNLATGQQPLLFVLDLPYDADAQRLSIGGGLETSFGPLALRAGSTKDMDVTNFSFGAGFAFSNFTLDYSFGIVQNGFDSLHNVSLSVKFGGDRAEKLTRAPSQKAHDVVLLEKGGSKEPVPAGASLAAAPPADAYVGAKSEYFMAVERISSMKGKTYVTKEGDTLKSVAMKMYGDDRWGSLIFYDNKEKITNPDQLPVGVELTLP